MATLAEKAATNIAVSVPAASTMGSPQPQAVTLVDPEGNFAPASTGGAQTTAIAAGATGAQIVKASPGRLAKVLLTSANGAAAISIYDNASAASGRVIGYIPASAAAGSLYDFQMPAANGITVGGAASNGAMTIGFS